MSPFVLLQAEKTSPQTLKVLEERASPEDRSPQFFSTEDFLLLQQLAACLLPQGGVGTQVDVALPMDARLMRGEGAGWRYAALPIEAEACRTALYLIRSRMEELGIDVETPKQQPVLNLLDAVQRKVYDTETFALSRWFENFKTEVVRYWLADPQTMAVLQYDGFADEQLTPQSPPPHSEGPSR